MCDPLGSKNNTQERLELAALPCSGEIAVEYCSSAPQGLVAAPSHKRSLRRRDSFRRGSAKDVRPRSRSHLFGALHRPPPHIPSRPDPGLDGHHQPAAIGAWQVAGMLVGASGAAFALACILTFVFVGRGTPAPFDPPRRLVVQGPYRLVRNPMYVGAGLALAGAALFYRLIPLLGYAGVFLAITHLFVVLHEEPTLRRTFARDYEAYCRRVGRWWPKR